MDLYLYSPAKRPYYEFPNLPEYSWNTTRDTAQIKPVTKFMRYCIDIIGELEQIWSYSESDLDRKDLLAVLQFHFKFLCMSLDQHLKTSVSQEDNNMIKRARDEFNRELKQFKDLLDRQLGQKWSEQKKISTWSIPQLLLRVIFKGKNGNDSAWTFGIY